MSLENAPDPPPAPRPETCCQRGCERCIFDYYDEAFADWEQCVRAAGLIPAQVLEARGQSKARRPTRNF